MAHKEKRLIKKILKEIEIEKEISRINWFRLLKIFSKKFIRAWELVTERRIKKYIFRPSGRVVWIAVGRGGEYLIYPHSGYCGCNDFYFNVIDGEETVCYHLLGQKLAVVLDSFDEIKEEDEAYYYLMQEWRLEVRRDD